jgi:predicted site-specific integrase-resolvase
VTAGAASRMIPDGKVVARVGPALNGHRGKFLALLCGPQGAASWPGIGTGSAGSARGTSEPRSPPQGRELVAAGAGEAGDDLVRDVTAVLTSMCACRYGRRASAARAGRPLAAAAAAGREAA